MLKVTNVSAGYKHLQVLHSINLNVRHGEIVTIIGANGAGKSTLLKVITGILQPMSGSIDFVDHSLTGIDVADRVTLGISLVPEGRRIFPNLTVEENLEMGAFVRRYRPTGEATGQVSSDMEKVYGLFPRLQERRNQLGYSLSGGEQQMLAIGRALMAQPRLLLLDEPSLGLAPKIVEEVFDTLRRINAREKTTMLVVEQNAYMALELASRGYVLENGHILLNASSNELLTNERVRTAYLGG